MASPARGYRTDIEYLAQTLDRFRQSYIAKMDRSRRRQSSDPIRMEIGDRLYEVTLGRNTGGWGFTGASEYDFIRCPCEVCEENGVFDGKYRGGNIIRIVLYTFDNPPLRDIDIPEPIGGLDDFPDKRYIVDPYTRPKGVTFDVSDKDIHEIKYHPRRKILSDAEKVVQIWGLFFPGKQMNLSVD